MKTITTFQDQSVWQIRHESAQILIAPQYGARLLTWSVGADPIIFWPENTDWSRVSSVRGGNPILFPFVARHMVDGVIGRWQDKAGKVYELPMHGFARDMDFEIIEEPDPYTLRMRVTHTPDTLAMYPFEFQFDVVYYLMEDALEVMLQTTNTGNTPLPYYTGHHFYFAVPHEQRAAWNLTLPCERWGWQNPDGSVRFAPATATQFTLDDAGLIDRFQLDFTSSQIKLEHTNQHKQIILDLVGDKNSESPVPWYDVTTWTEKPESDFFCIEPWLGLPNAIHHEHGLRLLPPGAQESAVCRISVKRN